MILLRFYDPAFLVENFPQEPKPFPYLQHSEKFNFDINLVVDIKRKLFTWIFYAN